MSVTISIGWWLAPTAVTILSALIALWPEKRLKGDPAECAINAICLMGATILSLASWLIWSLFT